MSLIRWTDRIAIAWRRVYAVPGLVEIVILALLFAAILLFTGCAGSTALSAGTTSAEALQSQLDDTKAKLAKAEKGTDNLTGALKSEHQRVVEADQAYAAAQGLATQAKVESQKAHQAEADAKWEAHIAPLRAILLIVTIVSALVCIAGIVVFALSFISTALAFGRTLGVIFGAAGFVGLVAAQLINVALSHLVLTLAGFVGLLAIGFVGWLIWDRHRTNKTTVESMTVADDAIGRLEELGKTSTEAALHAGQVKAAAIARQVQGKLKGRIEAGLAHVRGRAVK